MRYFIVVAMTFALAGCSEDAEPMTDAGSSNSWSSIYNDIVVGSCATSGCHTATVPVMDTAASAHTNLVNVTSSSTSCGGQNYVIPGDPDNSLLIQVLSPGACTSRMPLAGDELSESQKARFRSWIMDGAPAGSEPPDGHYTHQRPAGPGYVYVMPGSAGEEAATTAVQPGFEEAAAPAPCGTASKSESSPPTL